MRKWILCLLLVLSQASMKLEVQSFFLMERGYYQVLISDSISKKEVIEIIGNLSGVETVQYFSKEEELKKMGSYLYDLYKDQNPCLSTLYVYSIEDCKEQIEKQPFVLACSWKKNKKIDFYTKELNVGLLLIFQLFLIYNVFRTSVFVKIKVMKQLGASRIQLFFSILWPLLGISFVYIIL